MPSPVALITGGQGALASAVRQNLLGKGWEVYSPGHGEMDVTQPAEVTRYIAELPEIDFLLHIAGVAEDALMLQMTEAAWDRVIRTSLGGAFHCTRAVLPTMLRRGSGHILHVGSYSALVGPVGQSNYAAAKAGLIALTQATAHECGPHQVRANCVLPGFLETPMTRDVSPKRRAEILEQHCLRRFNTVEEAARFIVQLNSFTAVSGQVFQLDSRLHRWS
jgi:3-oxoacyl-[acyl-carrier protein] reductase